MVWLTSEHVNKTISGKRVFVDAVKDVKVKSRWVWLALNLTRMFLVRDKEGKTDTEDKHEEEGRDGPGGPTSPGTSGAPEAQSGKGRKDPIRASGGTSALCRLDLKGLVSKLGRMNSCCFKPPSL